MVKLRGHHLVENLDTVLQKAARQGVTLVEGGDDVCMACPSYQEGRCSHGPGAEDKVNGLDVLAKRLLETGNKSLKWNRIRDQIPSIISEWRENACKDCEWKGVCEKTGYWRSV